MTEPYELHEARRSTDPVLVVMLTAGSTPAARPPRRWPRCSRTSWPCDRWPRSTATRFIDHRARRPTMELRDGVNTGLVWADIELPAGSDRDGHDVLLLSGPEPDCAMATLRRRGRRRWPSSSACSMMVGLGAYPFATPHTRAARLSSTVTVARGRRQRRRYLQELRRRARRHGRRARARASPTPACPALGHVGAGAALRQRRCATRRRRVALLDGPARRRRLVVDAVGRAPGRPSIQRQRLDELVAEQRRAHRRWSASSSELYDAGASSRPRSCCGTGRHLPTGDELAAELERFLATRATPERPRRHASTGRHGHEGRRRHRHRSRARPPASAKEAEAAGYTGVWTAETCARPVPAAAARRRAHRASSSWARRSPSPSPATR